MSEAALPPIPPIIAQLTGPLFLGHIFNWCLFGVLSVQTYIYYMSFPKDRAFAKRVVTFVFVIELLQTVLATRDAFRNFGTGWGDMIDLDAVGWLWFTVPVMSGIISATGQTFFAWRIYVLSGRKIWISISVIMISATQAVGAIAAGALACNAGKFSKFSQMTPVPTAIWLGGTALCDSLIAASMTYYLSKSKTGFRATRILITKFIRITVETGLVCATFAILDLVFYLVYRTNNYHLAPSITLSKLYSNSLLAILNARVRVIGGRADDSPESEDGFLYHTTPSTNNLSGNRQRVNWKPDAEQSGAIKISVVNESDISMDDIQRSKFTGQTTL